MKTPITNKPQRRVYRWSKADWLKIKGLTTTFAESFLALANSRSVNDNYVVFKKFMEGLLKTDIPSKLSGSRNKLPWINTELKRQIRKKGRRFSKAKKSGLKEDSGMRFFRNSGIFPTSEVILVEIPDPV